MDRTNELVEDLCIPPVLLYPWPSPTFFLDSTSHPTSHLRRWTRSIFFIPAMFDLYYPPGYVFLHLFLFLTHIGLIWVKEGWTGFSEVWRGCPRDFPRAKPKRKPQEQPWQLEENVFHPNSFTHTYAQSETVFIVPFCWWLFCHKNVNLKIPRAAWSSFCCV